MSQTVVMLGLIFFLWEHEPNEFLINENILFLLATFSVVSFLLGIFVHLKEINKSEDCVRLDGTVKWYNPNKGFGFIEQDKGGDLFVHQSEIRQAGFRFLNQGDRVKFEVGPGKKGPVALKVTRTQTADPEKYTNYNEEPDEGLIKKVSETQLN